ncbi:MAG: tetratricopeptide repeat protein [Pyrinomonadaceae bacterium]
MKRCPECRRDYADDTLLYCLEDGIPLVQGSVPIDQMSVDDSATAILQRSDLPTETPTEPQISTTNETVILPSTIGSVSHRGIAKRLVNIPFLVAIVLVVGFFGYRYLSSNTKQIGSIAVMPFVNESGSTDFEYLSDGMTETLINGLSKISGLSVKARSSVFRYKGKESDARTIAKELNVEAILNGHLVRRGDLLTLNVELIDALTENVLWGNRYERKFSELESLQSDVARDISNRLKSQLTSAEEAKITKSYTTDPKAFELYLKGRYFSRQFTLDGFNRGVDAFNQAIAIDPNYALAYAGLSNAYFNASTIHLPPTEALPKVGEYAQKALTIDDSLAAAHHSIANYKANYQRDNEGAKREFDRALELDANDASIYVDYSQLLANIGESDRSISVGQKGKTIDPQDTYMSYSLAQTFVLAGRYDEALAESETTLRIDDKNWWGYYWRGLALSGKGMPDEAVSSLQSAAKIDDSPLIRGVLASLLARAGRQAESQQVVDDLVAASEKHFVSETSIAMGYVGLGKTDKAFEWLDRSLDSHDEQIIWIYKHPLFAPLRNDPRYKELLEKLNVGK